MTSYNINLKNPSQDLFSETASIAARGCTPTGGKEINKSSQLRRFYDELVSWNDKVAIVSDPAKQNEKYCELAPYIHMMRAKVAYAHGRKLVDNEFLELFNILTKQINSPQTLRNAKLFFEAFMGFKKYYENIK